MVVFGERLAKAEGEGNFAVGKMSDDFASVPFARSRRFFDAFRTEFFQICSKPCCCFGKDFERVTVPQKFGVRIKSIDIDSDFNRAGNPPWGWFCNFFKIRQLRYTPYAAPLLYEDLLFSTAYAFDG
jgi:hypothetical protein